ncbi:MAG: efflux RND transporter periplasmic adaptor subunit [Mesorhizobium sp.]
MFLRFIIAIVALVIVGGGIIGFNIFRDNAIEQFFANMPVQPFTVSTTKVEPITWKPGIEAIGTVSAAQGVDLTVETTGIVKDRPFEANAKVAKDDVLLQLDDAVQQADLASAKTQAALDQQSLDRALELQRRGVGSAVALDAARAAAQTSATSVTKAQAVVDQKILKAPFGGVIGIPRVELGQFIQPGTVVATLQDLTTMRADFSVPEQQLSSLKLGQPVVFGLTGDDMPFTGSISGIDPKVDPQSRLVSVRAVITNPDGKLSPGQFVQTRVELPTESDVIAIPDTALVTSLYGDFVFVVRPAEPKPAAAGAAPAAPATPAAGDSAAKPDTPQLAVAQVFVKAGRRNAGQVEILGNLKAGDEIVTAGQNRLSNGSPVVVDNSVTPDQAAKADQ